MREMGRGGKNSRDPIGHPSDVEQERGVEKARLMVLDSRVMGLLRGHWVNTERMKQ
jgi:hypothetical protein